MNINYNKEAVVIDIGHGGSDSGATSKGFKEKDMNLDTGLACIAELKKYNVIVYTTRTTDVTLSIDQRCAIANKYNAHYFVSIHHNAGGGDRGEIIHSIANGDGRDLAENIGNELKKIGQTSIKIYDRKNGSTDYYGVIRGTKMHSVIVEVCFIDDAKDMEIADTLAERKRNGVAIAHGILKQMGINYKPIQENNKEGIDMLNKIVLYEGDIDAFSAVVVSQKHKCPVMKNSDFEISGIKVKEVIQIGGRKEDADRFESYKNSCKYL